MQLTYEIEINVAPERVWDTMLDPVHYSEWTKAFSDNSTFHGEWKAGGLVDFIDPGHGGTRATIEVFDRPSVVTARHTHTLGPNGETDTSSPQAQTWVGTTETYRLVSTENGTQFIVEMDVHPSWEPMFNATWPEALKLLKSLCERLNRG